MAYTPIDKGENFMNTKLYTGNGNAGNAQTGVGFQPDLVWLKSRTNTEYHNFYDSIRGVTKRLSTQPAGAAQTTISGLTAFGTDGFTLGAADTANQNNQTFASWNWIGANPPKKTYIVKVVSDGGNKYRFDDFGTNAVTLELSEGGTFIFDQSDSSNNGHPLRFSTTSNGTHAGGSIYTTGVVVSGTPGQAGAKTTITVAASAPTLYYFCTVHSGMGGQANTPTTNSFTNLDGSSQSNVSPNTISRFSIVSYTGTGSNATVGHGLGFVPKMIIVKRYNDGTASWMVYHQALGNNKYLSLDATAAEDTGHWNSTSPTGTVFSIDTDQRVNASNASYIAYCFGDVQGFSKMGSYTGNGNVDGTFIYTGFKPAFTMIKSTGLDQWSMFDAKRNPFNVVDKNIRANSADAEADQANKEVDYLSNGIKLRTSSGEWNTAGTAYIYMAFAENPFTSSAGTPVTAR